MHAPLAAFLLLALRQGMIIPVRCFTCGKVIGNKWDKYLELLQSDYTEGDALDALSLKRYCCRRMLVRGLALPAPPRVWIPRPRTGAPSRAVPGKHARHCRGSLTPAAAASRHLAAAASRRCPAAPPSIDTPQRASLPCPSGHAPPSAHLPPSSPHTADPRRPGGEAAQLQLTRAGRRGRRQYGRWRVSPRAMHAR